eukprot:1009789-Rhodomonas_salina.1
MVVGVVVWLGRWCSENPAALITRIPRKPDARLPCDTGMDNVETSFRPLSKRDSDLPAPPVR